MGIFLGIFEAFQMFQKVSVENISFHALVLCLSIYLFPLPQVEFKTGIYDSLLLEFAVAHKPTQPKQPDKRVICKKLSFVWYRSNPESVLNIKKLCNP